MTKAKTRVTRVGASRSKSVVAGFERPTRTPKRTPPVRVPKFPSDRDDARAAALLCVGAVERLLQMGDVEGAVQTARAVLRPLLAEGALRSGETEKLVAEASAHLSDAEGSAWNKTRPPGRPPRPFVPKRTWGRGR